MKLAKWGNSLALRIPAEVIEKTNLKPGDEVTVVATGDQQFQVFRDHRRDEAIKRMRALRFEVPADYRFDRSEIYDR